MSPAFGNRRIGYRLSVVNRISNVTPSVPGSESAADRRLMKSGFDAWRRITGHWVAIGPAPVQEI